MKRFYIQNVNTGRYFLRPGWGTTEPQQCAHVYTQDVVNENPHLVRSLGKGITRRVPADGPALADK